MAAEPITHRKQNTVAETGDAKPSIAWGQR